MIAGRRAAFGAATVNDDAGTGPIGAEDPILHVQLVILFRLLFVEFSPAHHAVSAIQGDGDIAFRARLSR